MLHFLDKHLKELARSELFHETLREIISKQIIISKDSKCAKNSHIPLSSQISLRTCVQEIDVWTIKPSPPIRNHQHISNCYLHFNHDGGATQ